MPFKIPFFLFLILSSFLSVGQNFYLSNGENENGKLKNINSQNITITNYSGFNRAVFNSTSQAITKPLLVISQKLNSFFIPVKWVLLEKKNSDDFYSADVFWDEDGDYKLSITDGGIEILNDFYSVNVNEDDILSESGSSDYSALYNDPNSTFYYIDSKVEFCESINENNEPVNFHTEFHTGNVIIFVSNNKPIITKNLKVSVYKLKGKNKQELIEEKYYPVDNNEMNVSFIHYFGMKGSFLISVYTNDDVWVNDGNIKIK